MSTIIGKITPTLDQQIAYMRKDRTMMENGLTLLEDPKDIGAYEEEIVMMKAIEENLIALKMLNPPQNTCTDCGRESDRLMTEWVEKGEKMITPGERLCPKCSMKRGFRTLSEINEERKANAGTYKFKNPVQRGAGDDYPLLATCTDEFPEPHMEPARWPRRGDSVMVMANRKPGSEEWVDAYVVEEDLKALKEENHEAGTPGVVVKTYWGELLAITDLNKIQFSKKEVPNG